MIINGKEYVEKAKSGSSCLGVIVIIGTIIFGIFQFVNSFFLNLTGNREGYITTLVKLFEFPEIMEEPLGRQTGEVAIDTVLKLRKVTKKENVTWINVYKLENNKPINTYILIPDVIKDIEERNKYVIYAENSKTWKNYYDQIDLINNQLLAKYGQEFRNDVVGIDVNSGNDNILKESIKKTHFILSSDGYLGVYKSNKNEFYYIKNSDKKLFLDKYKHFKKIYDSEYLNYFPK